MAFEHAGPAVEPAVYHDDFCDVVEAQPLKLRGVLVWHDPIEGGRTRARLDAMPRHVAARGVFVSAHPDTILRMGTKDVLVELRDLPYGCDAHRVDSIAQLAADLPPRRTCGPRVLEQHRAPYFADGGHMVDQAWQPRPAEGMVRAHLVGDRVAGFDHQAVNAPVPAAAGQAAPQLGPRPYSGADDAGFQPPRRRLEGEWLALLVDRLAIARDRLPILRDADFMLGEAVDPAQERHLLCEIDVSGVAPYPDPTSAAIVAAVRAPSTATRARRGTGPDGGQAAQEVPRRRRGWRDRPNTLDLPPGGRSILAASTTPGASDASLPR